MTIQEYNHSVQSYTDDLFRFALKSLGNQHDAEDVLQLAFEVLWKERENVEYEKSRSYLFTVVYRRCMDVFRQKKNKRVVEIEQLPNMQVNSHSYEFKEYLNKALERLDGQSRTLILLKDIEGYKYDEISELTGLTLEQVKVYLHRSRKLLKNYLQPQNV